MLVVFTSGPDGLNSITLPFPKVFDWSNVTYVDPSVFTTVPRLGIPRAGTDAVSPISIFPTTVAGSKVKVKLLAGGIGAPSFVAVAKFKLKSDLSLTDTL